MEIVFCLCLFILRVSGINITIQGSSKYVVPGSPFTFICIFKPGGLQAKMLVRDGDINQAVQLSNDGSNVCYNVTTAATVCDPLQCSCSQQGVIFTAKWILLSIEREHTWNCRDVNAQSSPLTLKVAVLVTSVKLIGVSGVQIIAVAGQNLSLTCVTGQSRPRSYIQWYIGNDNYTINSTTTVSNGQDELKSVTSILTFTVKRNQANLAVNCKAYNIDRNMTVELVTKPKLNIQYPLYPMAKIKDVGDSLTVTDSSFVTLHCEVEGGSPLAVINWSCFCGTVTNASESGIARSIITFTASSSLNGKLCICSATHPASVIKNDSVQIIVTSKPQPPRYLEIFKTKKKSIVLKWERGSKSNFQHEFVILVQNMVSLELRKYLINDDLKKTNYSFEIEDLLPSTSYKFQLYSMNENGNSSFLSVLASVASESKDHGYENETIRDIDTYESLQPGEVVDNPSTYQRLKKTKTGNDDIQMDVYVNTRKNS